jgi:hypothetical protein
VVTSAVNFRFEGRIKVWLVSLWAICSKTGAVVVAAVDDGSYGSPCL